ncbi:MAG: hypothetical protein FJ318_05280 [SAR202 cluster bacterium]|nr:hypothetical protein [SAR202 cluster bacterium]
MPSELRERLDLAITLALEAGDSTLPYFQVEVAVEQKADGSPVTMADRGAEQLLRKRLAVAAPDDAIVGEEFGSKEGTSGYTWYLDPIDGTQAFVRGVPLYGTMIGIERGAEAVAGVIAFPALREIVFAAKGMGAWHAARLPLGLKGSQVPSARPARVSATSSLAEAMFSCTSPRLFHEAGLDDAYRRIIGATGSSRGWSDCYGHYLVATGRIDVMADVRMHVWDNAPLKPIVEEAGGRFSDLRGGPSIHGDSAITSNGTLHEAVLSLLAYRR